MADFTITGSQVLPGGTGALFVDGVAGEAVTAGKSVYFDVATTSYMLADANASLATSAVRGIALHAAGIGQPIRVQTNGTVTIGAGAAIPVGAIVIQSATPGGLAPAADLATGMRTSVIGFGGAAGALILGLNNSGQLVP